MPSTTLKKRDEPVEKASETRSRKKARQAIDLMTGTLHRHSSIQNLLGEDLSGPSEEELKMIFRIYDQDGDGYITPTQLSYVMRSMGYRRFRRKVDYIMINCDPNKSGTIELSEFINYMKKLIKHKKHATRSQNSKEKTLKKKEVLEDGKLKKYFVNAKGERLYKIEKLLEVRTLDNNKKEYLVKWMNYPRNECTWEPEENIDIAGNEDLIEELDFILSVYEGKMVSKKSKTKNSEEEKKAKTKNINEENIEKTISNEKKSIVDSSTAENINLLKRSDSLKISDFYTLYAGQQDDIKDNDLKLDTHLNPIGRNYDLGHESGFGRFRVLVGLFCARTSKMTIDKFNELAGAALRDKGFKVDCVETEKEFVDRLTCVDPESEWYNSRPDVAWIVSNKLPPTNVPNFMNAIRDFHHAGGGLAIWGDNDPWYQSANAVLKDVFKCRLLGNTPGKKVLKLGDGNTKGTFGRHLITTGINHLYEGVTICRIVPEKNCKVKKLAISSDDTFCMGYLDAFEKSGRLVIDCGITKLYKEWDSAGTARYVRNLCVWLLGIDHRLGNGFPVQGGLE